MKTFGVRLRVKSINISKWVKRGPMLIHRRALDNDDPDHPYNWILKTFEGKVQPESFGVYKPQTPYSECPRCGRKDPHERHDW